jgi:hypothetical protein
VNDPACLQTDITPARAEITSTQRITVSSASSLERSNQEFLAVLRRLDDCIPPELDVHLIVPVALGSLQRAAGREGMDPLARALRKSSNLTWRTHPRKSLLDLVQLRRPEPHRVDQVKNMPRFGRNNIPTAVGDHFEARRVLGVSSADFRRNFNRSQR